MRHCVTTNIVIQYDLPPLTERYVQAQRAAKAAAEPAAPSAPAWQPPPPSPTAHIPYPVIDQTLQSAQPRRDPTASTPAPAPQRGPIRGHREAEDWEPQPEEDWEGVEPATNGPNRGARLLNQYAEVNSGVFPLSPPPGPLPLSPS